MKRMYAKLTTVVLCISLMASLSGCSPKGGNQAESQGESMAVKETKGDETTESTGEEEITIRVASVYVEGHSMNGVFTQVLEDFRQEHPNVTIVEEFMPSEELTTKLRTDAASDNLPDIFPVWTGIGNLESINAGMWMDISEELENDPQWKDGFGSGTLEEFQYEETPGYWAVPVCSFGLGVYYNMELFEQANAMPPTTWNELLDVIGKLQAEGIVPWEIGAKDTWRTSHLFANLYYKMYGIEKASQFMEGTLKWDDESVLSVYYKMVELVDAGAFDPNMLGIDYAQEVANFANGRSAMQFNGSWAIGETDGEDTPDTIRGKIGFFPFPDIEGSEVYNGQWFGGVSDAFAVSSKIDGEKKELVIELLKDITSQETAKMIGEESGNIPAVNADLDSEKTGILMPLVTEAISNADKFAGDITGFEKSQAVAEKFPNVTQAVLGKIITPEEACKELAQEADKDN